MNFVAILLLMSIHFECGFKMKVEIIVYNQNTPHPIETDYFWGLKMCTNMLRKY